MSTKIKSKDELLYDKCTSPAYISPELTSQNAGYKGCPIDIWSAAVCFYELLYGKVPFKLKDGDIYNSERFIEAPEYFRNVSESAIDLLQGMLHMEPGKRLTAD